jgi:hypothetical protein
VQLATALNPLEILHAMRTIMRLSMTEKTRGAKLIFTGYAAMVLVTVPYLIRAHTLIVKARAPVAALRMVMGFHGKTRAQTW